MTTRPSSAWEDIAVGSSSDGPLHASAGLRADEPADASSCAVVGNPKVGMERFLTVETP